MSLQPLEDRIVVKPERCRGDHGQWPGHPRQRQGEAPAGHVLAVGPGRRSDQTGELIPVDVDVGDVVVYSKYGGTEITVDGDDVLILNVA